MKAFTSLLCMTALLGALALPVKAAEVEVPVSLLVKLALKALTYDRGMDARTADAVNVGVLVGDGGESSSVADEITGAVKETGTWFGKPVNVKQIKFSGGGDLEGKLGSEKIAVLFICPGLSGSVDAITGATQAKKVASVTAVGSYVDKGATLGVGVADGKPKLRINLKSAKTEGSDFPSMLLKIADVVQ